jgi:hypothetical protein
VVVVDHLGNTDEAYLAIGSVAVVAFGVLDVDDGASTGIALQAVNVRLAGQAGHTQDLTVPVEPDRCDVRVAVAVDGRQMADRVSV